MAAHKLDIFALLESLNSSQGQDIYARLSEDERKGFSPLITMRWMSGTGDARQIMMLNEFANPVIFSLGRHPHLLMKTLHACSSKVKGRRYAWSAVRTRKGSVTARRLLQEYFEMSAREAALLHMPPLKELELMAEELGWTREEIKKLEAETKSK